jgi:putative methyltransferase (TIGR04325 family)
MQTRLHSLLDRLLEAPPVAAWRRVRFDASFEKGGYGGVCRGVYSSHAQAAAAAARGIALGYDNEAAGKMYLERLERVYPADYPMMLWLDHAFEEGARRVFDLGGHVGIAYYAYRRFVHFPADLSWLVHDVPAVMEAGQALARERDSFGQIAFVDEPSAAAEAARADVFFTSGCQQYLEQPLAERLRSLSRLPTWVLVNLLPLHETADYWTVQSIGAALCPYHIERRSAFVESMRSLGYTVEDAWENAEKRCEVAFSPEHDLDRYHGMAFRLASTKPGARGD